MAGQTGLAVYEWDREGSTEEMKSFALTICFLLLPIQAAWPETNHKLKSFVNLYDIAPNIQTDIQYARSDNFTGSIVPGYENKACYLDKNTAQRLLLIEDELNSRGYGLVIYDCYRPEQAIAFFVNWVRNGSGPALNAKYYPRVPRPDLIKRGFIGEFSSHSSGRTIDVGLKIVGKEKVSEEVTKCNETGENDTLGSNLNMGTTFDCFDPNSAENAGHISKAALKNRLILKTIMEKHGFRGYRLEWWHFTFTGP